MTEMWAKPAIKGPQDDEWEIVNSHGHSIHDTSMVNGMGDSMGDNMGDSMDSGICKCPAVFA